jgi:hypothetical protein
LGKNIRGILKFFDLCFDYIEISIFETGGEKIGDSTQNSPTHHPVGGITHHPLGDDG